MDTLEQKNKQIDEALAKKLEGAKSLEELKEIAAKEGCELSDEQLEGIAGGNQRCPRDWSCITQTIAPGPPIL